MRHVWLAAGLAIALVGASGCGGSTKAGAPGSTRVRVLTLASQTAGGAPPELDAFVAQVEGRSHGSLRIDVAATWRAGDPLRERHILADVRAGKADLAWIGTRAWDWLGVTAFDALIAPLLIDTYPLERAVFQRGIPQRMLTRAAITGIVPIGVLPGPLRTVLGVRAPFVKPSDFVGATVGADGPVAEATARALGATPRQVVAQTPLRGLDALEIQLSAIDSMDYDRTAKYAVDNVHLWPRPIVLVASTRTFRSLTADQRATLRQAAGTFRDALAARQRSEADARARLCRRGRLRFIDATPSEVEKLRSAVAPVYARLEREPETRQFVHEIERLKAQTPASTASPRCRVRAVRAAGRAPTVLDGVWQMSVTRDYLRRVRPLGGHPTEEDFKLDAGDYRLVLRRGRFTFTQDGPAFQSRTTGTFTVDSRTNTIALRYIGGHDAGASPQRYRWSLYRGALTFRPIGRSIGTPALAAWHRAGR